MKPHTPGKTLNKIHRNVNNAAPVDEEMERVLQASVPQPLSWTLSKQPSDDFRCFISALQTLKSTEQEN